MRGNSHVQFLGGGGTAMFSCYPTTQDCDDGFSCRPITGFAPSQIALLRNRDPFTSGHG